MNPFDRAWKVYQDKFPHTFGWQTQKQCFAAGWDAALKAGEKAALDVIDRACARSAHPTGDKP